MNCNVIIELLWFKFFKELFFIKCIVKVNVVGIYE